jgi:hypothetical protein
MDSENMSTRDTQLTTRESVPPTAYTLGKAAAWLGSFLLGLVKGMKARNDHTGGDGRSRVGGGKRARKNRRRYRS